MSDQGRNRGRKKLSGSAALTTIGNGWQRGRIYGPWEQLPRRGPDIVLAADAPHYERFADVTRAVSP
jgi:hypothetical protein